MTADGTAMKGSAMNRSNRWTRVYGCVLAGALAVAGATTAAQQGAVSPAPGAPDAAAAERARIAAERTKATQQDHQNMMAQLGITKLRPGPSGNENAPNARQLRRGDSRTRFRTFPKC